MNMNILPTHLLSDIPKGEWAALSHDQDPDSLRTQPNPNEALQQAYRAGEKDPFILRVPDARCTLVECAKVSIFQYTEFPAEAASAAFPDGRTGYRPILPVSIISGERRFSCNAIVDSGADYCTFPGVFMNALGIDVLARPDANFRGPTGAGQVSFCDRTIDLGFTEPYIIYACSTNLMIGSSMT